MTIKVLTLTSLFPNSIQGRHGIFVENRLRHLVREYSDIELRVVAPIPWFPLKGKRFGEYGKYASVPKEENRYDVAVYHPRYPVIPKFGMNVAPYLMALSLYPFIKKLIREGFDFDLIDAHYFYPDGVAASIVAKWLGKPFICTARGSDISLLSHYPIPKKLIARAVEDAEHVITVCQALKDEMLNLEYKPKKISVLRNGVDLEVFAPPDNRGELRRQLGIKGFTVLSVGHLIERKGHHLVIDALQKLPNIKLLIVGDGPLEMQLKNQVKFCGLEKRVMFLGAINHQELKKYYGASDALVLASSREGWANVLLESMACGTPVVATSVWGTPEVVAETEAGVLVDRTVDSICKGIVALEKNYPDRAQTRKYAERFSWFSTIQRLNSIIHDTYDFYSTND